MLKMIAIPEFAAHAKFLGDVRKLGGKLFVSGPRTKDCGSARADLIEGAQVYAIGRITSEITSATNSLGYLRERWA